MGSIVRTVFGGSQSKNSSSSTQTQESGNKAFGQLGEQLNPAIAQGNTAMGFLGGLLGINDSAAKGSAGEGTLMNFLNNPSFKAILERGMDAIGSNSGAKGLLNSGARLKAMSQFAQDDTNSRVGEMMDRLVQIGQYGGQAASTLANAGQYSTGKSTSTATGKSVSADGAFKQLFPGGMSDRRLKHKLELLGANSQGIPVYSFEFKHMSGVEHVGVMADEVERTLPAAIGEHKGYKTVDYDMIEPLPFHGFTAAVRELPENV